MAIYLASASPRRRELLGLIVPKFLVEAAKVEETLPAGIAPAAAVELLARKKAAAVAALHPSDTVIGSDTVVAKDGVIFGKPRDRADARRMLEILSGETHQVFTGVSVRRGQEISTFSVETAVTFFPLSPAEIEWYLDTGEPMDKAGSYGIQGLGARFVSHISGDYYAVMGLPIAPLYHILSQQPEQTI